MVLRSSVFRLLICMVFFSYIVHAGEYQTVKILVPEAEASVHDNNGNLTVTVEISPAILTDGGDYLVLLMDGAEVARGVEPRFELKDIDRGTHTLQIQVRSADGTVIFTSAIVNFLMWRASALFPTPES
jgi:hypothetical protein